jgi:hypothetical protein
VARDIVVTLVCDLCGDGTHATDTIQFGAGSRALYEIDTCDKHFKEVDSTLQRWRAVARPAGGGGAPASSGRRTSSDRQRIQEIREWARSNGYPELGERGRLPGRVVDAYESAHRGGR